MVAGSRGNAMRRTATAVANQGLSSATNLGVNLYLIASLAPDAYGEYVLAFVACSFAVAMLDAVWLTQMVVGAGAVAQPDVRAFARRCLSAGLAHVLPVSAALTIAASMAFYFDGGDLFLYAGTTMLAITGVVLRDFMFRYGYLSGKEGKVMAGQLIFSGALAVLLLVDHVLLPMHSPAYVLLFYCLSGLVSAGFACHALGLAGGRLPWHEAQSTRAVLWRGGRWASGSTLISWTQTQSANYVMVFVAGVAAVGESNAVRILLSPFVMLSPGVQAVALPRLVRLWAGDPQQALRWGTRLAVLMWVICIAYCLVLWMVLDLLEQEFFAPRGYGNVHLFALAWMVVICFDLAKSQLSLILKAASRFRNLMFMTGVSASVAIVAAFSLGQVMGGPGAVFGLAVGESVIVLLLAVSLWKLRTTLANGASGASAKSTLE